MNIVHVAVGPDFSDVEPAEIFLHHRVLVIPVTQDKSMIGLVTRSDLFHAVAERFLSNSS
jgi:predicted transcriptional regulator